MAKRITDDEQNLRRKARRRLIGAMALTLVVVVVLPMVLDSEPKPAGRDIELRIPDQDKVGEFIPGVPVSEGANGKVSAGSAVGVAPPSVEQAAPGSKPAAASKATTEASNAVKPGAVDKPAIALTESFVAQVGAYSNADTAKQELSKLKKWGFKAYTETAGDKIRVRVGPYAEREKAEKVRQQLEKHGLHPVVMSAK
jgi:DedD protein